MTPYPRHLTRTVSVLDGIWDFAFIGEDVDLRESTLEMARFTTKMSVPSAIDASPALAGVRGTFAYRTQVRIAPGASSRLFFHGLSMWCRIYADGQIVAENALPYSGFWVDVPRSALPIRELIVVIDNRFSDIRVPLQKEYFDFYAYGGIFRSVEWHEFDTYMIERAVG